MPDQNFLNRGAFANEYADTLAKYSKLPPEAARDTWWRDIRMAFGLMFVLWQKTQAQLDNHIEQTRITLTRILELIDVEERVPTGELAERQLTKPEESGKSTWDPFS